MKRIKHTLPTITTRAQAESAIGQIRALEITRRQLQLERETAIKHIDDRILPTLTTLETQIAAQTETLATWAESNPTEFNGKKSLECLHGTCGWRIGQPTLKTLSGWTWDKVMASCLELEDCEHYVRTKQEVDKRAILCMRDKLGEAVLKEMGVRVVQDEPFFVEPKIEDQPQTT
jgi:phage host-nuclease inhibitor protein Gam